MDFQRVIGIIKDIVPFVVWGSYDFTSERRTHKSFGLFGDNQLSFFDENVQKFDALVDRIWEEKKLYDLPRKDIEDFILAVIIAIHENTFKNDDTLQKKWEELLSYELQEFTVLHPIYGTIVNDVTQMGPFVAYNLEAHHEILKQRLGMSEEVFSHFFTKRDVGNYLSLPIMAKKSSRAMELARKRFELFEDIAKFWLGGAEHYDIGIFNYKGFRSEKGFVVSPNGTPFFSSSSKGAWQSVNIKDLAEGAKILWNIVERYFKNESTEIENRLIKAIQWIGIANSNESDTNKYVQYIFALESLLQHRPRHEMITPSITYQLAEYGAFIVGENANLAITTKKEVRSKIFKDIKKIYAERSKIVHGRGRDCSTANVFLAHNIMYVLINSILANEELLHFTSMEQLSAWVEDKKFAD